MPRHFSITQQQVQILPACTVYTVPLSLPLHTVIPGMSVHAVAARILAADFSAVHTDSWLQCSGWRHQLSGFRRHCCAINAYK